MTLTTLLSDHRRTVLQDEQRAASQTGKFTPTAETEIVDAMLDGVEWETDCPCGYEEGRSEADKRYHEENCL